MTGPVKRGVLSPSGAAVKSVNSIHLSETRSWVSRVLGWSGGWTGLFCYVYTCIADTENSTLSQYRFKPHVLVLYSHCFALFIYFSTIRIMSMNSTSDPLSGAPLSIIIGVLKWQRYTSATGPVILIYDYFLTLDDEVCLISSSLAYSTPHADPSRLARAP